MNGSIRRLGAIKKLLKLYLDNPYRRARRLGAPFVTVCRRFMRRAEVVAPYEKRTKGNQRK